MWKRPTRLRVATVLCIIVVYAAVLVWGTTESTRRSMQLRDETSAQDRVIVSVLVTGVNPVAQEFTAQLRFRLVGNIARDEVTPAVDLKLLANNFRGRQEFDFPKGQRVNRIDAVFPLDGNLSKYPFDRYETTIWLLMTTPASKYKAQGSNAPKSQPQDALEDQLAVGAVAMERSVPLPLSLRISADIPGAKFGGSVTRNETTQLTGIDLKVRRANDLIVVSILINVMMTALAMSVLAMVLRVTTSSGESDLVPLSMAISLIFGLPALRNVQPGVPPVGTLSDYVSFIWAELIVAVCAVITVGYWLLQARRSKS
jgi:Domain of unknown function (DUF4436)